MMTVLLPSLLPSDTVTSPVPGAPAAGASKSTLGSAPSNNACWISSTSCWIASLLSSSSLRRSSSESAKAWEVSSKSLPDSNNSLISSFALWPSVMKDPSSKEMPIELFASVCILSSGNTRSPLFKMRSVPSALMALTVPSMTDTTP